MSKPDLSAMIASMKAHTAGHTSNDSCAIGSGSRTCWMKHDHASVEAIGADQIVSIRAMIAYVSHTTGRSEFRVERDFSDHFCIPNPKCLPIELYDTAIHYMAAQVPPSARC